VIYYGGPLALQGNQPDGLASDITRFNTVSSQQLASNIRTFNTSFNNLRRHPTKNLDLSVLKKFSLGERRYFQLRFESFNTTNHVTLGTPNLTPTLPPGTPDKIAYILDMLTELLKEFV
jgi:hypothetical protein